jgi:hypothetical protein
VPRRSLLTAAERASLLALPSQESDWIRHYRLSETDLAMVRSQRGAHNRLGFAVQLCLLRYLGIVLPPGEHPPEPLLHDVARQLRADPALWTRYAAREVTRREHVLEIQAWLAVAAFGQDHHRRAVETLADLAMHTDQGLVLARSMVEMLRREHVTVPAVEVVERACAEALTLGTRRVYAALTRRLSDGERERLGSLLEVRDGTRFSTLAWLGQPPGSVSARNILQHLERLQAIHALALSEGLTAGVRQNRWMKLAREGAQMTGQHLRDLEVRRREATLVAVVLETRAALIDETVELHERMLRTIFSVS